MLGNVYIHTFKSTVKIHGKCLNQDNVYMHLLK